MGESRGITKQANSFPDSNFVKVETMLTYPNFYVA